MVSKQDFFAKLNPNSTNKNKNKIKINNYNTFDLIATGNSDDSNSKNPIISTIARINPNYPVSNIANIANKRNMVAKNIQTFFYYDKDNVPFQGNTKISVWITYYTLCAEVILGKDLGYEDKKKIFNLLSRDFSKNNTGKILNGNEIKYRINRIMINILGIRNSALGTRFSKQNIDTPSGQSINKSITGKNTALPAALSAGPPAGPPTGPPAASPTASSNQPVAISAKSKKVTEIDNELNELSKIFKILTEKSIKGLNDKSNKKRKRRIERVMNLLQLKKSILESSTNNTTNKIKQINKDIQNVWNQEYNNKNNKNIEPPSLQQKSK